MPTLTKTPNGSNVRLVLQEQKDLSHDIRIERGIISRIPEELGRMQLGDKYAIIADSKVARKFGKKLRRDLRDAGLEAELFPFDFGEKSKTVDVCEQLGEQMMEEGFGKKSVVIAMGGGVSGDIGGLVASLYYRGVPHIQVPTTLLAQVDSSIGGKNGVNLRSAKNVFGTNKQPAISFVDLDTLNDLPWEQFSCGLSEVVKYGIIADAPFFDWLEEHKTSIIAKMDDALIHIIEKSSLIKGRIVELDKDDEKGPRMVLNFGHTMGHAIEALSGYMIPHGNGVAIGMMIALRIANRVTGFPKEDIPRVSELLYDFNSPVSVPEGITTKRIMRATRFDKKVRDGETMFCLPLRMGEMADFEGTYLTAVDESVVKEALEESRHIRNQY
jgi:3-dehydroquinate synthase